MPTMSRGTSFKAGFLYEEALRETGDAGKGGWRRGMTVRNREAGRGAGRPGGDPACRIGNPVYGPSRATTAPRSRTGTRRDRTGPLLPDSRRGCARAAPGWRCWCERGDSNPQGLPHWHLKPARLPIPPLSRSPMNAQYAVPEPWMGIVVRVSRSRRRGHRALLPDRAVSCRPSCDHGSGQVGREGRCSSCERCTNRRTRRPLRERAESRTPGLRRILVNPYEPKRP